MDNNKIIIKSFLKIDPFSIQNTHILSNVDSIKVVAVNTKFIIIGTASGSIVICDHLGNIIKTTNPLKNEIITINTSLSGDSYVCCSLNGKIIVNSTISNETYMKIDPMFPTKAVSIHPYFEIKLPKCFVAGISERLILYQKNWLSETPNVLHSGDGVIQSIRWQGQFLAWSTFMDVNIMDMEKKEWISHIAFTDKVNSSLYLHLIWKDNINLIIANDNNFHVCQVKKRKDNAKKNLPEYMAEIVNFYIFKDVEILGVIPNDEKYILLIFNNKTSKICFFELTAINISEYILLVDEIVCKHIDNLKNVSIFGNAQHSDCIFIASSNGIHLAKYKDNQDFVAELVEKKQYEEALFYFESGDYLSSTYNRESISISLIDETYNNNNFDYLFEKINWINKSCLKAWIHSFEKMRSQNSNILKRFIYLIPLNLIDNEKIFYQAIIEHLLRNEKEMLLNLINKWPVNLFDVKKIYQMLDDAVHILPNDFYVNSCLAKICIEVEDYSKSLLIQLKLKSSTVFEFINNYKLYSQIKNNLSDLYSIDCHEFVKLVALCPQVIEPSLVVSFLSIDQIFLEKYLWYIHINHPAFAQPFADVYVELSLKFTPNNLINFLKNSTSYDLSKAIKLCQNHELMEKEMIYLLERIGNHKKSLEFIIRGKDNVDEAIDFCLKYNDPELWDHLIEKSKNNPEFTKQLLLNVGCYIDPVKLIDKIPSYLSIQNLKDALAKIMHDYWIQVAIYESSQIIFDRDCLNLYNQLIKYNSSGFLIKDFSRCLVCKGSIVVEGSQYTQDTVIFYCGHTFHQNCLLRNSHFSINSLSACIECDPFIVKSRKL